MGVKLLLEENKTKNIEKGANMAEGSNRFMQGAEKFLTGRVRWILASLGVAGLLYAADQFMKSQQGCENVAQTQLEQKVEIGAAEFAQLYILKLADGSTVAVSPSGEVRFTQGGETFLLQPDEAREWQTYCKENGITFEQHEDGSITLIFTSGTPTDSSERDLGR